MADKKKPQKKHPKKAEEEQDSTEKQPRRKDEPVAGEPRGPGDVNPPDIHREYVEQWTEGGESPTREAFDEALEQWRRLPGAIVGVARDIRPPKKSLEEKPAESDEEEPDESKDESTQDDQPDESKNDSNIEE